MNQHSNLLPILPERPFGTVARDDASAAFFDAAKQGRYLLRECCECGAVRAPEIPMCTKCLAETFRWIDAKGTGEVVCWVVLHTKPVPGKETYAPRVMATVELVEGPWVVAALMGVDPADVAPGRSVVIGFAEPEGSEPIPIFR